MSSDRELVAASHENFAASFRKLVQHSPEGELEEFDGGFAFVTGLPFALFNGCVVAAPSSPAALDLGLRWVEERAVPHRVWIEEGVAADLASVPLTHDLRRDESPYPCMVLHPVPESPARSAGITVEPVPAESPEALHGLVEQAGLSAELAARVYPSSFLADPDVRAFVGRLDGRAVASSLAIRSHTAGGVYAVGTLSHARRRGIGAAVTWAAVDAGRAWGCRTIALQSSQMGLPLYEGMGFRTVVRYITFSQVADG